jgi:structural maintenance of chromosome 1
MAVPSPAQPPALPTGRVHSLIIDNFKSYKGKEVIGPFKDFTTIIGPNGSGKSNLMDAISFVLGVRSSVLRGSSLGELIYSSGNAQSGPEEDRAEVTLVFEYGTGEEKDQLRFSRAIVPSSSGTGFASQYRLDGKAVSAEAYNLKLESFGILVKARNFLVFQGDIENVAQMSPKDLTNLFETISGSAAHKKAYEAAETRLKDAESSMAVVFSKRKAIMAEKRQKKEQKTEAEKHIGLMAQLEEMKIKKILWKLYHLMEDQKKAEEGLSGLRQQLGVAEKEVKAAEDNAEKKKRKHAGVAKEALLVDKKIRKKKNEMEKKSPEMIKIKEQIAHIERRIKAVTREQEGVRAKAQDHSARMNNLKTQMAQLKDAQAQVDTEIESNKKSQLSLSPDLLKEYADIKRAYGGKAAALEAELASLQASAQADEESLRMINDANLSIDRRIEHLGESLEKDAAKMEAAKATLEKLDVDRKAVLKQRDDLRSERRAVEAKKSQLERKLEETEGTLRDAKAESKQSQREEAMRGLVTELKRENPSSVYGIVTDLADPTSAKYKLAMSVVMGRDIDSVVVDTPATAMKCIEKVKQRRLPPMTFLPADTIRLREVNPALRTQGGTSKLAIDCLNIKDERATRAFKSICADAMLCDSVDEARRLAYDGAVRQRVIALDGTAFLKNGLITGGMTSAMEDRAKKWDQEKVGKLKEARNGLAKELLGLPQLREVTQKLQSAEARSARLDNEKNYASAELKSLRDKLKESNASIAALSKEKGSKEPAANELRKQMSKLYARIDEVKAKMDVIAGNCFKDFVKKIGVSSIKEYEEKHLKAVERLTERRAAIISQYSRVENQLEYESSSNQDQSMAKVAKELKSLENARADLEKEAAGFEAANKKSKEELIQLGKECDKLKKSLSVLDSEMKEMKEHARKATDALAARHREISTLEMNVEQIKMQQNDQLEAADLENVILPIKTAASTGKRRRGQDAAQASTSTSAFGNRKTDDLDFSSLDSDDLLRDSASQYNREAEMSAAIDELAAQLASMAPNLKAVEQFEEIKRRERQQMEEVERSKRGAKEIEDEYNRLRQLRFDLFNAALTHISECIDPIYKELTRSNLHPSGGQAYLSPENTEEPFSGGIKFSAMPPTKRFRDMEQLSGGEKTVAALALLFAVHSFHPSPFFVLDEIDAALDSSNVARVALYLRSKTRANSRGAFQGIVISLKDVFYANADALVGVCRAKSTNSSTTLTFDLDKFSDPAIGA